MAADTGIPAARRAKLLVYRVARGLGLFRLARWATRRRLRVLGYHAFAIDDEAEFRSKLFITGPSFERRLRILRREGYRVLGLDEAVRRFQSGAVEPDSVVITIDDGFVSTLTVAAPLLRAQGYPATVYLTTYHVATQTPVFDLLAGYLLWKSYKRQAEWQVPGRASPVMLDLSSTAAREAIADQVCDMARQLPSEAQRVALWQSLAVALGVDIGRVLARQAFRLMSPAEARQIVAMGVDVELHTHRHRFPADDPDACIREIDDNRAFLEREVGVRARHFCYPSGVYSPGQWPLLAQQQVLSATTCDTGLVRLGDSPYGWCRFLDGEMVSDLEFEAEVSGFAELLRGLLRVNRRARGASVTPATHDGR